MKPHSFILAAAIISINFNFARADQFCDGFARGYATGYKQATGSLLNPITPLCPLQPLKKLNDPQSDFEHGYIIGLQKAMSFQQND